MWTAEQIKQSIALWGKAQAITDKLNQFDEQARKRSLGKLQQAERERLEAERKAMWEVLRDAAPTPVSPEEAYQQLIKWPEQVKTEYEQSLIAIRGYDTAFDMAHMIDRLLTLELIWREINWVHALLAANKDNPIKAIKEYDDTIGEAVTSWQRQLVSRSRSVGSNLMELCQVSALAHILDNYQGYKLNLNRIRHLREQVEAWVILQEAEGEMVNG